MGPARRGHGTQPVAGRRRRRGRAALQQGKAQNHGARGRRRGGSARRQGSAGVAQQAWQGGGQGWQARRRSGSGVGGQRWGSERCLRRPPPGITPRQSHQTWGNERPRLRERCRRGGSRATRRRPRRRGHGSAGGDGRRRCPSRSQRRARWLDGGRRPCNGFVVRRPGCGRCRGEGSARCERSCQRCSAGGADARRR